MGREDDKNLITQVWDVVIRTAFQVHHGSNSEVWPERVLTTSQTVLLLTENEDRFGEIRWPFDFADLLETDDALRRKLKVMAGPYGEIFIRKKLKELGYVQDGVAVWRKAPLVWLKVTQDG